jgi:hypothetical protein
VRPTQKYIQTAGGTMQAEGTAKGLKFYEWPEGVADEDDVQVLLIDCTRLHPY